MTRVPVRDTLQTILRDVVELEGAIERAVIEHGASDATTTELERNAKSPQRPRRELMPRVPGASLAELERYAILRTLEHTGGSTARAAEILGISTRTIQYRLHQYGAQPKRKR